ncbi:hypothetical protein ACWF0M_23745 [Kribbella sp. NPDC055110]
MPFHSIPDGYECPSMIVATSAVRRTRKVVENFPSAFAVRRRTPGDPAPSK